MYTGKVTSDGYEVSLRNGSYEVEAVADGYRTTTHIVVNDADVTKDILMVSTKDKEQIERVSDIYVGYKEKGNVNYNPGGSVAGARDGRRIGAARGGEAVLLKGGVRAPGSPRRGAGETKAPKAGLSGRTYPRVLRQPSKRS